MSVTYDANATFMGVRMTQFRNLLRTWNGGPVSEAAQTNTVGMDPRTAAALVDEADVQGLFGIQREGVLRPRYRPTEAGVALMAASPLKPIKREKAALIIDDLLERCEAANRRNDLHFTVDRVWLFGSYIKGKPEINDIDVVVETGQTDLWEATGARFIRMACKMGGKSVVYAHMCPAINAMAYVAKKVIYGDRQNPRLAPNDIESLKSLGCECQLIFDRERGGRVTAPVLNRHPESPGRSPEVRDPLVLPMLNAAGSLIPVSLEFIDADTYAGSQSFWPLYRTEISNIKVFPHRHQETLALDQPLELWLRSLGDLDGRKHAAIIYADWWKSGNKPEKATGLSIKRELRAELAARRRGRYDYVLDIAGVGRASKAVNTREAWETLGCFLVNAIGADLEKAARHALTIGHACDISVSIRNSSSGSRIGDRIEAMLRLVLCAPEWSWLTDFASRNADSIRVNGKVIKPSRALLISDHRHSPRSYRG